MLSTKQRLALRCESLEGRDCPAAQIFQSGGFLLVAGDSSANTVAITDLGNGRLIVAADGRVSVRNNVTTVAVATGFGDDAVSYNVLAGTAANRNGVRLVAISAGAGNDSIDLNGSALTKSITFGVDAGGGNDDISATLAGVALGNAVNLFLSGSSGDDSVDVNAAGEIDGLLNVRVNGGVGSDSIGGDINANAGSTGQLSAVFAGSFNDDVLDLSVTGAGLPGLASLNAVINGGIGTDIGVSTANVTRISIEA